MLLDDKHKQRFARVFVAAFVCVVALGFLGPVSVTRDQTPDVTSRLNGFDAYMEQLGLTLESQMGPIDVLVIDHVEQPSEN